MEHEDSTKNVGRRNATATRVSISVHSSDDIVLDSLSLNSPSFPGSLDVDPNIFYDVGIICSVRLGADREYTDGYVSLLESSGLTVFYPPRDTDQVDHSGGLRILRDNFYSGFLRCREIHIVWNPESQGSVFDLGLCFGMRKPLRVINPVRRTREKSFANAILDWQAGKLGVAEPAIFTIEYDAEIDPR